MKIKIPEELISEFIGDDLEPIEGSFNPVQSKYTSVEVPTGDENTGDDNIPQTTDKYIQHARRPWWWSNVYGGYGFASVGTVSESKIAEDAVKEDIISNKNPQNNGEILKKNNIPDISSLDSIYDVPLIKKQVLEFTIMLQNIGKNISEEDESDILAIILNYVLTNAGISKLNSEYKTIIKNAIK